MKLNKITFLLFLLLLTGSCAEELNFSQTENIQIKPVFTASLTNFSLFSRQFFNSQGIQETSVEDISGFEVFDDSFVKDNVVKIDFYAEIKNNFDRDVTIDVDFLDENNNLVYNFPLIQVQSKDLNYIYSEEIEIANNPDIKNTFKVKIKAELQNTGTQMDPTSTDEFNFKSSVTVYIESKL